MSMTLTKSDIANRLYKEAGLSRKEAQNLVDQLFKIIKETLGRGEKIKISGFGNFIIRDKGTRIGRNPQTGGTLEIAARRVLTFRPSNVLKDDITSKYGHRIDDEGNENASIPPVEGESRALTSFRSNIDENDDEDDDVNYES
ncbi:MAG: integration host factor subunit alpha [Oligoflexia bacterium]|nr:integration host factor subunit alpha [Oligoflexia bacterium]